MMSNVSSVMPSPSSRLPPPACQAAVLASFASAASSPNLSAYRRRIYFTATKSLTMGQSSSNLAIHCTQQWTMVH